MVRAQTLCGDRMKYNRFELFTSTLSLQWTGVVLAILQVKAEMADDRVDGGCGNWTVRALWCHWYRPHRNAPQAQRTCAMSGAATIIL